MNTTLTKERDNSTAELMAYSAAAAAWIALILLQRQTDLALSAKVFLVSLGLVMPVVGVMLHPVRRAITCREFASYFYSPVGYVVLATFTALSGLFFVLFVFAPGQPIETAGLFVPLVLWTMTPVTPAISMRLMAEEHRSGNLEALVTAPITDAQLILGKWLGAMGFLSVTLLTSLPLILLLEIYGSPDYGPVFTGYVGMVLVGGLFLAVGVFASVLNNNQIIAFIVALGVIVLFMPINLIVTGNYLSGPFATAAKFINPYEQFLDFSKGILDTGNFAYFLSATAMFLTLAVKCLESRKWR